MKHYFGLESDFELSFFGPVHLLLIAITVISILLIYKYREKLKKYPIIRKIISAILFANMIIYIAGAAIAGIYDIKVHLPIHYCYITGFLFQYMLLKEKKTWYNMLYYAIFFCTITVVIFQDPAITPDRYEFILLVISHHFLLISSFYTLYVLEYPVNVKGYKPFIIYSVIVYTTVFILNRILGTDYIFNSTLPPWIYEILPFVKALPPLTWLILLSIPLLALAYFPIKHKNKITKAN